MSAWCDGGVRAMISDDAWASLAAMGSVRRLEAGDVLLNQGDAGTRVYVLVEGRVKVTRCEADGAEVLLAIRGAGEIIGEMSVLDESVASATVTALGPCVTRLVAGRDFMEFVRTHDLAVPMLRHAAAGRRESEQIRIELSTLPVSRRLVRALLRLMDAIGAHVDEGIAVGLGVSQEELARAIGASRSQVAATLGRLRSAGILTTGRRHVVVRDPARLRAIDAGRG